MFKPKGSGSGRQAGEAGAEARRAWVLVKRGVGTRRGSGREAGRDEVRCRAGRTIGSSQSERALRNLAATQFSENCVAIIIIEF